MTEYVLGVDGGASKTDYLLFDTQGNLKAHLRGAGTCHEHMAGGLEELESTLDAVIPPFLARNGLTPRQISGAAFGMSGVDTPGQKAAIEAIFTRMGFENFRVMNDSFIGIKAGSRKGYGVCVVNGSGNTVGGIDRKGRWLQIGGMGYVSCEDGGAGGLAFKTLRAVYEQHFCLGEPTNLTPPVMALLGVDDPVFFMQAVCAKNLNDPEVRRQVLGILFRCANDGDEVAARILREVGAGMARCVAGCAKRLDMGEEFDVVLVGSVTLKASCPILLDTLKSETLRLTGKKVNFIPLAAPPAVGGVLWAMELALGRLPGDAVTERTVAAVRNVI